MKKYIIIPLAAIALSLGSEANAQNRDWAQFGRYGEANKAVTVQPKAVFMGDSITDNWDNNDESFFTDNNFVCRGISGQTTSEMLVRFRRDVIDLHPKYVVIMAGTNDIAMNNGYIAPENILGNIISMCELAKANKIKPILCSVTPCSIYKWRPQIEDPAGQIMALNSMIREYAKSAKIKYVDYHSALKNSENGMKENYSNDECHPTLEAYKVMESIILEYL